MSWLFNFMRLLVDFHRSRGIGSYLQPTEGLASNTSNLAWKHHPPPDGLLLAFKYGPCRTLWETKMRISPLYIIIPSSCFEIPPMRWHIFAKHLTGTQVLASLYNISQELPYPRKVGLQTHLVRTCAGIKDQAIPHSYHCKPEKVGLHKVSYQHILQP